MSQDTTASTHEQMEEQLEQLEQPDAIFEAELKQALKESKPRGTRGKRLSANGNIHTSQRILLLRDLEGIEEKKELQTALRRPLDEVAAADEAERASPLSASTSGEAPAATQS